MTNTLRRQQAGIGNLINQGQDLLGEFVARRAVFHAMMRSLTSLVDTMSQLVVNDRSGLDSLITDMRDFTGMMAKHDDLLGNMLQISPIFFREAANLTGEGNAVNFNANNVPLVDSWMCAISGRAKQFGMIEYFKDCK